MYYNRFIEKNISHKKSETKVKLLLGPRQSGKSTLLKQHLSEKPNVMDINLQDRRVRIKYEKNPGVLLQELEASKDIHTVFIDEIQKIPELLDDVQYLYDAYGGDRFEFFLSGSSARQLKTHSANLLPGRTHLFHLSPVLQSEQREAELIPLDMPPGIYFPVRPLEEILVFGNLPGLYSEDKDSWEETVTAYSELYLENEIRKEHVVSDMGNFMLFLKLAAAESGQTINYSKLASEIGISVNTVKNYYQILEDTYIGLRIHAFGRSRKKIISAPRFLFFDLGMRNALAEFPMNSSLIQLNAGSLFEQFVMIELFYRCQYHGRSYRLSTWRTNTGAEVDVILETPDGIIPIEIKWTDSPKQKDIRHINTFMKLHDDISKQGYLICRIDKPRKLTDTITALPWDRF